MKYIAILRDSLRETIDSKVFFVVLAISALAVALLATLSLKPNAPSEGLQKLAERLPDGSQELELPILGRFKATPPFTQYLVQDLEGTENTSRPWDSEYSFTIESRDLVPYGGRIAILRDLLKEEEAKERHLHQDGGRKSRGRQIQEEIVEEARRLQEAEKKKKDPDQMAAQRRLQEQLIAFIVKRMTEEVRSLTPQEMEEFIKSHLENQGNWRVTEVKLLDLPPEEKTIKLKVKTPVQEGEDVRIKTEDAEGEVNKFRVKVVSQAGTYSLWPHKATLLFGAVPIGSSRQPGQLVYSIARYGIGWVGAPAIMLLGCVITAFYIPNMLRKGTIDLLLAKPINRATLLFYKYVGGLTFMFLSTTVLVLGLWVVLGLRSGLWEPAFLLLIPVLTFEFALFYALSTLTAVLTRSPIVCILLCVLLWAVLFGVGMGYAFTTATSELKGKDIPEWVYTTSSFVHAVVPHYLDLDWLNDKLIKERLLSPSAAEREKLNKDYEGYGWGESLLVTSLYILGLLGLACWRFSVKDY